MHPLNLRPTQASQCHGPDVLISIQSCWPIPSGEQQSNVRCTGKPGLTTMQLNGWPTTKVEIVRAAQSIDQLCSHVFYLSPRHSLKVRYCLASFSFVVLLLVLVLL